MARYSRIKMPYQIYSIVTRVNNSAFVFTNKELCKHFLQHIKYVKDKLKFKFYGFVVMASHVHLLLLPNDKIADISTIMKWINGGFAQQHNKIYKKKGHFWMSRFKSKIVQNMKYALNTLIYFAMNPVRAGITDNPLAYQFSSINNAANKDLFADILDPLPFELEELLIEFLKKGNFIELLKKLVKIAKKYSFNLRKTKNEQLYRNFTGEKRFVLSSCFDSG